MIDRVRFFLARLRERLWIKPLIMCLLSLGAVFTAKGVEATGVADELPVVEVDSVVALLTILSASMLVIATFAVGSMVASYASAGSSATPRTFPLIIADDVSQNALSTFIGAFIFSVVAIVFLKDGYYLEAGRTVLFLFTVVVFAIVILTFVRWVDRIARLGRLGETVDKVEAVALQTLQRRRAAPTLGGANLRAESNEGSAVYAETVGYVQRVDVEALQRTAEAADLRIAVTAIPGAFAAPGRPLALVRSAVGRNAEFDDASVRKAFHIKGNRTFEEDPRFGLIVLAEIAGRALSPAVNDPGTAIDIIGTLVRLLAAWGAPLEDSERFDCRYDRVEVPELSAAEMFDDAFTAIARDGAGAVEVAVRLQKAFASLATIGHAGMRNAVNHHARLALARAEREMSLPEDLETVRRAAAFAQ